jgi:hypothetical protein
MNFHKFLDRQKTEDRRAFIIYFNAKSGKTRFARQIIESRADVYYLDLQTYALNYPNTFKTFDFKAFKDFLLEIKVDQSVILIDNPDFLFNTWLKQDDIEFENWIKIQLRSPGVTEKTMIFIVQNDTYFENLKLINSHGESRVIPLNSFESL